MQFSGLGLDVEGHQLREDNGVGRNMCGPRRTLLYLSRDQCSGQAANQDERHDDLSFPSPAGRAGLRIGRCLRSDGCSQIDFLVTIFLSSREQARQFATTADAGLAPCLAQPLVDGATERPVSSAMLFAV